jgi:Protein of unknown function (DUF1549)/Protein of unknown function (DUF1553)/Planctomycete cytochrome C
MRLPPYLIALAIVTVAANRCVADHPSFDSVVSIFEKRCVGCHNDIESKGEFSMASQDAFRSGGESGAAIEVGKPEESLLVAMISGDEPEMPQGEPNLTPDEVERVRQWISDGAVWPKDRKLVDRSLADNDWWSLKSLVKVELPGSDVNPDANPIDLFIQAKLDEHGLKPSPPADRGTLIRRLSFDLTGLPPTEEEVDAFCADDVPDAYSKLVDRLLASPRYGERWARHWLDVVHYGDTHGYDKDKPRPNAWPYRDYVIRAFNTDKPYARFVEEQIAGDAIWPGTADGIEAMGFIAAGPWDYIGHAEVPESKTDGKIARHLDRDDMVANTIGTFCSLTIHCAQCHQHKFDPITQEDYYRLQSVFSALDRTDRKYFRDDAIQKRFDEITQIQSRLQTAFKELEEPLKQKAGDAYVALSAKIDEASKNKDKAVVQGEAFGYHSAIVKQDSEIKWVQVDLGESAEIRRVVLRPCYDDFHSIGAGFGFPIRFRIEVCDEPSFGKGVTILQNEDLETFSTDFKNPGLSPFEASSSKESRCFGRYVRITATRLATRSDDFIFALAELQVFDPADKNISQGKKVTALDSIEAAPRWGKKNLTDGEFPTASTTAADVAKLVAEREALLLKSADPPLIRRREELRSELAKVDGEIQKLPAPSIVYAAGIHHGQGTFVGTGATGGKPRPIFVLARGQVTDPMQEVLPGALAALDFQPYQFDLGTDGGDGARRIALARWVTDPNNPLTWRSIVNRVWLYHFGRGLVDTPNDFGRNGGLPSHPELLDWLAIHFRDHGGSLKQLHKLIVTSQTYQQSSSHNAEAATIDSSNAMLWKQNRRRLEAEAIRDSVLAVSGRLDLTMGGPGWQDFVIEHPEHSPHYEYSLADPEDTKTWRRSVYRFIVRSQTQPWMTSLDCADPSMRVDKRNESLSSIQALALLNNGFMLTQSKHFADRVSKSSDELSVQVENAYRMALGSPLPEASRRQLVEFAQENGLEYLCRLLFNLNAFTFVD